MNLTKEQIDNNYNIYLRKLQQVGVDTKILDEAIGDKLKNATYSMSSDLKFCGEGQLINTILQCITKTAVIMNESNPEVIRVDKNTLVKVCLLHQISKSVRAVKNTNQWEVDNRGKVYAYDSKLPAIKNGLHSVAMCQSFGIQLSTEEIEAMTIIDRADDEQSKWFASDMANIVRMANEITYMIDRKKA